MTFSYSSRRDFVRALMGGAAGCCFTYSAFGQAAPVPIKATKLSNTLVLIEGDGGNMALVLDADGLMLVDSG
jgi:hypothetical protein